MSGEVLIVGLGNDFRGDDAVGPVVARTAAARLDTAGRPARVLAGVADPLDLLGRWDDAALVVIVDAVRSGAPAGRVSIIDVADARHGSEADDSTAATTPSGATSTHGIGTVAAIRLARVLGRAPRHIVLVTVEGSDFARGDTLSAAVAAAVPEAVARVLEAVGTTASRMSPRRVSQR
jgi:hydrogenase maturation protease